MFYTFVQNNSGGRYVGPECVCVEGNSLTEVEQRFDDFGPDRSFCECCGPRWSGPWDSDELTETPTLWGEPLENSGRQYVIFYLDGNMTSSGLPSIPVED